MLHINFNWETPEVPEFDPEIHNPERVFAFLCYRGIHYAKWVTLDPFKPKRWLFDQAFLFVKQTTH